MSLARVVECHVLQLASTWGLNVMREFHEFSSNYDRRDRFTFRSPICVVGKYDESPFVFPAINALDGCIYWPKKARLDEVWTFVHEMAHLLATNVCPESANEEHDSMPAFEWLVALYVSKQVNSETILEEWERWRLESGSNYEDLRISVRESKTEMRKKFFKPGLIPRTRRYRPPPEVRTMYEVYEKWLERTLEA